MKSHQRRLPEVQVLAARPYSLVELLSWATVRIQHHLLHRQRRCTVDHLHWPWQLFPQYCRPENIVPINHRLERCDKFLQALSGGD